MKTILTIIVIALSIQVANANLEDRESYYFEARVKTCFDIYISSRGYVSWDEQNVMCGEVFRWLNNYFTENRNTFLIR